MTPLETQTLRALHQLNLQQKATSHDTAEQLEDYVLGLTEAGASVRGIASQLGIAFATVQGWKTNAKRRRSHE